MKEENKELLLKDLCSRLPYGVKLGFYASATTQTYICTLLGLEPQEDEPVIAKTENGSFYMLADNVKPYLFPLSNMTLELRCKIQNLLPNNCDISFKNQRITFYNEGIIQLEQLEKIFNLFNMHHIDYRGLISMGLAIDATGLNIY